MNVITKNKNSEKLLRKIIPFNKKNSANVKGGGRLMIKDNNTMHFVTIDDIILIKAEGNYSMIYQKNKVKLMVSKTLKHYDRLLANDVKFIRTHKSYLVNVDFVKSITQSNEIEIMGYDHMIPLARSRRGKILSFMERLCIG